MLGSQPPAREKRPVDTGVTRGWVLWPIANQGWAGGGSPLLGHLCQGGWGQGTTYPWGLVSFARGRQGALGRRQSLACWCGGWRGVCEYDHQPLEHLVRLLLVWKAAV